MGWFVALVAVGGLIFVIRHRAARPWHFKPPQGDQAAG